MLTPRKFRVKRGREKEKERKKGREESSRCVDIQKVQRGKRERETEGGEGVCVSVKETMRERDSEMHGKGGKGAQEGQGLD